ncbi:hypothetical protein C8F01DRAFT_1135729 [Mycena amicta]|nr:hypothetical protein C8F01DRAFT_1135729 [Mycena amicta]
MNFFGLAKPGVNDPTASYSIIGHSVSAVFRGHSILASPNRRVTRSFSAALRANPPAPAPLAQPPTRNPSVRRRSSNTEPRLPSLSIALAAALSPIVPAAAVPDLPLNSTPSFLPSPPAAADKKHLRKLQAKAAKLQPKLTPLLRERDHIISSVNEIHHKSVAKVHMVKTMKLKDRQFNASFAATLQMHKDKLEQARRKLREVATDKQYARFMDKFQFSASSASASASPVQAADSIPTFPAFEMPDWRRPMWAGLVDEDEKREEGERKSHLRGGGYEHTVPMAQIIGTC